METKFFKIFRVGTHKPGGGAPLTFTEIDLMRTEQRFNARNVAAPLVPGHPYDNQPVLGYVKKLVLKDGFLFALADVSEALVKLVKAGLSKHVSVKFSSTRNPDNPGEFFYDLQHVGFLENTQNPACKGLGELSFAASKSTAFVGGFEVLAFASFASGGDVLQFAEGPMRGWGVDPSVQARHQAAQQISATYPEYSYLEAVRFLESV